ncbi:ABC transporter C-terminal domain-containing protein, partial [Bacillus sp. JJ722]|uniref:ABC transporter C-terminal domain-containing protein n=1 Tax=Bacillus sp. JJ722 TaxID=3122973 RepID=UPI002FFF8770
SADESQEYLGDYDYYVQKKQEQEELEALEQATAVNNEKKVDEKVSYQVDKETKKRQRQIKRRLEEIEKRIEELEAIITVQNEQLCEPEIYQDHEKVMEINKIVDEANSEMEQLMDEWSQLDAEQNAQ